MGEGVRVAMAVTEGVAEAAVVVLKLALREGEAVVVAAEGEGVSRREPEKEGEAVLERLAEGLTVGVRECKKSGPSSRDTLFAELTLHVLGTACGQKAYTKPAQSARE